MKKRDVEVLFCFEPYDELVLLQLREFDRKQLTSVEKDMRQTDTTEKATEDDGMFSKIVPSLDDLSDLAIFRKRWPRYASNRWSDHLVVWHFIGKSLQGEGNPKARITSMRRDCRGNGSCPSLRPYAISKYTRRATIPIASTSLRDQPKVYNLFIA